MQTATTIRAPVPVARLSTPALIVTELPLPLLVEVRVLFTYAYIGKTYPTFQCSGVWVTEFAETGINIWFFSRADVPSSLSTDSVDTSTLGTPTGAWPASSCNPSQFFQEQEIVIDITLCGDWAGLSNIISSTGCPALNGTNTCYTTYVLNPANYDTAYFEIASVKLFGTSPSVISTAAASTPTTSAGGHGSSSPSAADKQMSSAFLATAAVVFAGMGFLL